VCGSEKKFKQVVRHAICDCYIGVGRRFKECRNNDKKNICLGHLSELVV